MSIRDIAHVQDDVNPHILCILEDTFSHDAAQSLRSGTFH